MYREIGIREHKWIDKLLDVKFKDIDILKKQVLKSKISYRQEYAFISIKFNVQKDLQKYPHQVRVPVEMRAYQDSSAPIVFLLHMIEGIIDELEIISADASRIKEDCIQLENVEYEINKELL